VLTILAALKFFARTWEGAGDAISGRDTVIYDDT
jgi:hypothetical protein